MENTRYCYYFDEKLKDTYPNKDILIQQGFVYSPNHYVFVDLKDNQGVLSAKVIVDLPEGNSVTSDRLPKIVLKDGTVLEFELSEDGKKFVDIVLDPQSLTKLDLKLGNISVGHIEITPPNKEAVMFIFSVGTPTTKT